MKTNKIMLMSCIGLFLLSGCANASAKPENTEKQSTNTEDGKRGTYLVNPNLEEYTEQAAADMLTVPNVRTEEEKAAAADDYETIDNFDDLEITKPYQVGVKDPDRVQECVGKLLDVYLRSYNTEALQKVYDPADSYYSASVEILSALMLAGDSSEFVMEVSFRQYDSQDSTDAYKQMTEQWGRIEETESGPYLYADAVIHVKMVSDYVYELCGITEAERTRLAFAQTYPETAQYYETAVIPTVVPPQKKERASVKDSQLQITLDGSTWKNVPLSTAFLFARGDQRDGALTNVQENSYYLSNELSIIAYGGNREVPLSVIVSTDAGNNWSKTVVSREQIDVRAIFVSRPQNSDTLFLLATGGRTMSQEGCVLFRSEDKGVSFQKTEGIAAGDGIHSLTTDFGFTDENTGFICIRSEETPQMLYTKDGGAHWEYAEFTSSEESFYSMVYAPAVCEEGLELYAGEAAYPKNSGNMCRMISKDNGMTWESAGIYNFR